MISLQDKRVSTFLTDLVTDCFKVERSNRKSKFVQMMRSVKFKLHEIAIYLTRTPPRINDARADESYHFPYCMLLTGIVTQITRKNAVGSKLDLFQAKNQAAMAWTGALAAYLFAEITALQL